MSFVALSRVRRLCDFASNSRIREQRFRKSQAKGVDKLAEDFHRRQQLPFHDAVDTAGVLGFNFND